jgi:hypothetical protein
MEVGAPFLERTRDKLRERARAIIERCPELEYYFDDPTLRDIASRVDPKAHALFSEGRHLLEGFECWITLVF